MMTMSQLLTLQLASKFDVTRQSASITLRINLNVGGWSFIMPNVFDVASLSISAVNRLMLSALGRSTERNVIKNQRSP